MRKKNSYVKIGVLFGTIFLLNACYVCDKFYTPVIGRVDGYSFKDSIITVNCWMPPSQNNHIVAYIYVNTMDSMKIKSMELSISSQEKNVPLKGVKMSNDLNGINYALDNKFEQSSFDKLPKELTTTSINGKATLYSFDFENEKERIDSKYLILNIDIILKGIKENIIFKRVYTLQQQKSCSFRVH
jgi:hypothetical protein